MPNNRKYHADLKGKLGAIIMAMFSIFAAMKFVKTEQIFFVLLAIKNLIASYYLLVRRPGIESSKGIFFNFVVYFSAAIPLFYSIGDGYIGRELSFAINILLILGFTLMAWALLDLGRSFGVTPSNRGIVTSGVYRYFNHPMYAGYVLAELGFAMLGGVNTILFFLSIGLYWLRAKHENKILGRSSSKESGIFSFK